MKPKKSKEKIEQPIFVGGGDGNGNILRFGWKENFYFNENVQLTFLSSIRSRHLTDNHAFSHHPITENLALKILSMNVIFRVSIALFSSFYV